MWQPLGAAAKLTIAFYILVIVKFFIYKDWFVFLPTDLHMARQLVVLNFYPDKAAKNDMDRKIKRIFKYSYLVHFIAIQLYEKYLKSQG